MDEHRKLNDLVNQNAELAQFSRILAHDLRTPVISMSSLVESIRSGDPQALPKEVKDLCDLLNVQIRALLAFVDECIEYSLADFTAHAETDVDLSALFAEIVLLMHVPSHIEMRISPRLPHIRAHPLPLKKVFLNLLGNSLESCGGRSALICVEHETSESATEIRIRDNGPGMRSELVELLNEFFRSQSSAFDQQLGLGGTGLRIVKHYLDQQGASVNVHSEFDVGTTFSLKWPLQPTDTVIV